MQLQNKTAVIYGAGGAVGGAVATAFAREGAKVFLTGRTLASVEAIAKQISAGGGQCEVARVDALDEESVEGHMATLVGTAGKIDISFNAVTPLPQPGVQGIPIAQLPVDSFVAPIASYLKSHFLTARAAARRMAELRSGVILMHTPEPARLGAPLVGGMGPAWAAMESFNRNLSAEFAASGIRAICIRSTGLPETKTIETVFGLHANAMSIPPAQFLAFIESMTHTKRSVRLAEVANAAVFAASDKASSMTGTVINLTGGIIVD
jgi:NAD(P)-dependent dehydrogenase (short-subunit alcohol dehydrogenase family)